MTSADDAREKRKLKVDMDSLELVSILSAAPGTGHSVASMLGS